MKRYLAFAIVFFSAVLAAHAQEEPVTEQDSANDDTLIIVWTSGDPEVAEKMMLMYSHAAVNYGWFEEVKIIVWGPSARLVAAHKEIQEKVAAMQKDGIVFEACVACASQYGVVEELQALGMDVKGMGGPLTEYIKSGKHIVTF
jgi:hypothetical protein